MGFVETFLTLIFLDGLGSYPKPYLAQDKAPSKLEGTHLPERMASRSPNLRDSPFPNPAFSNFLT